MTKRADLKRQAKQIADAINSENPNSYKRAMEENREFMDSLSSLELRQFRDLVRIYVYG